MSGLALVVLDSIVIWVKSPVVPVIIESLVVILSMLVVLLDPLKVLVVSPRVISVER